MNRPPRRPRSPPFGMGQPFDGPEQSPVPLDYNDIGPREQAHFQAYNQPPGPHQSQQQHHIFSNNHGISNNNNTNNELNDPSSYQTPKQHPQPAYPQNYLDQHTAPNYRSNMREPIIPNQSPPPMIETTSIYKILCVTNISPDIGDAAVKEAILNDFSRFGDIMVSVCHDSGERLVYIYFRSHEEAREARHSKLHSMLFDRPIDIEPIYEPRPHQPESPHIPCYPRRRSMTPPEYYQDNGMMTARRPPVMQATTGPRIPQHHDSRGPSPPGYPYSPRYAAGPVVQGPLPHHPSPYDRHYPEMIYPHPNTASPYTSPPGDQPRPYPMSPPMHHQYPPVGGPSSYAYLPYRDRDRPPMDPYYARSPRSMDPYAAENRAYPRAPPMAPNVYPEPSQNYRPNVAHSRPAYHDAGPHRHPPRDYRREKYRENHLHEREEIKPSRVIFITNIDPNKSDIDLKEIFEPFGLIENLEVKKIGSDSASAIIRFSSMDCAYRARTAMNGKYIGATKCRIIYGKVEATRRLWLGGLGSTTTLDLLDEEFSKFGDIMNFDYVSGRPYGYIEYATSNQAQFAVMHLKGTIVAGADKRIRMEYVDSDRKTLKPETNTQASLKASKIRSGELWNNNEDSSDQGSRKRSLTPIDNGTKRPSIVNNHSIDTGYYDSANRASTSSITKSSTRSSPGSPTAERAETDNIYSHPNNKTKLEVSDQDLSVKHSNHHNVSFTDRISSAKGLDEIVDICDTSFQVEFILRSFNIPSVMYMCSGQKETIQKYLAPSKGESHTILRITQRWRLHPQPKLDEVKRHMQTENLGIFLIKPRVDQSPRASSPQNTTTTCDQNGLKESSGDDKVVQGTSSTQTRALKNLISYLEQRNAAGVISVNYKDDDNVDHNKLLYTFPPGEFAITLLNTISPNINQTEHTKDEYMLGVLVGTIDPK